MRNQEFATWAYSRIPVGPRKDTFVQSGLPKKLVHNIHVEIDAVHGGTHSRWLLRLPTFVASAGDLGTS